MYCFRGYCFTVLIIFFKFYNMAVDFNIEIRKKQLESLDQFVTFSRDKVKSILGCLDWSVEKIQEEQRLFVNCPHNSGHKVPAEKIEDHIDKCKLTSAGYSLQEELISEPVKVSEESNMKIGTDEKIVILTKAFAEKPYFKTAWNGQDSDPLTYSRLFSTFSTDERLVLYDYCIANTQGPPELPEFNTSVVTKENGDSTYTKEALRSFERDIKRRSVKYKPIHNNQKNYKEELRQVINSQMQQYTDWLERLNDNKRPYSPDSIQPEEPLEEVGESEHQNRPYSSVSKISNSSLSSSGVRYGKASRSSHSDSHLQVDEDTKSYHSKEYHPQYLNQHYKSRDNNKYTHHDEDSQESNTLSKVSSVDMDSSCENYEITPRNHSRDSSIQSSYKYKGRNSRYEESKRYESRSESRSFKKRDHSSGSSRHSSKSHRSEETRSRKYHSREKSRRHKDSYEHS